MIDKEELRSFLGFLDSATDQEIARRERDLRASLDTLPRGDLRRDVQFLHRKLLEEKFARFNLQWVRDQRKAQQS
jgi:hypothetical protein